MTMESGPPEERGKNNDLPSTGTYKDAPIVPPWSNFRGMSYGTIATMWSNWLFSTHIDSFGGGNEILFLRANSINDRTRDNGYVISEQTPIFIPIHVVQYHIGALFKGTKIESEIGIRHAICSEIKECDHMWLTIESEGRRSRLSYNVVKDLLSFYAESPLFRLNVSEKSPLREKINPPMGSGTYHSIVGGYFVLLTSLKVGKYLLRFGSKGLGPNYSDAYYEINVKSQFEKQVTDVSRKPPHKKINWPT